MISHNDKKVSMFQDVHYSINMDSYGDSTDNKCKIKQSIHK